MWYTLCITPACDYSSLMQWSPCFVWHSDIVHKYTALYIAEIFPTTGYLSFTKGFAGFQSENTQRKNRFSQVNSAQHECEKHLIEGVWGGGGVNFSFPNRMTGGAEITRYWLKIDTYRIFGIYRYISQNYILFCLFRLGIVPKNICKTTDTEPRSYLRFMEGMKWVYKIGEVEPYKDGIRITLQQPGQTAGRPGILVTQCHCSSDSLHYEVLLDSGTRTFANHAELQPEKTTWVCQWWEVLLQPLLGRLF